MVLGSSYALSRNPELNLSLYDTDICQVQETKLLGIIIDNKLSWKKHINNIIAQMGNGISVVRRSKKQSNK